MCLQMNGAVSKVNKKFISYLTRAKPTPSAAATVQVSHALPAVRFSCLLWGRGHVIFGVGDDYLARCRVDRQTVWLRYVALRTVGYDAA